VRFFPYLDISTIKSVATFAQSIKKANRPRVVTTLITNLNLTADSEAGKQEVNVGREMGIPPKRVGTAVADKNIIPKKTDDSQLSTSAI
jgi:hypothetical protein